MLPALLVATLATAASAEAPLKPAKVIPGDAYSLGARYATSKGTDRFGVWDLAKLRQIALVETPATTQKDNGDSGTTGDYYVSDISADGRELVVSRYDKEWRKIGDEYASQVRPMLLLFSLPDGKLLMKRVAEKGACDHEFGIMGDCPTFYDASLSPDGSRLFFTEVHDTKSVHGPGARKGAYGWTGQTNLRQETATLVDRSDRVLFKRDMSAQWHDAEGGRKAGWVYQPSNPRHGFLSDGRPVLLFADDAGCVVKGIDGAQVSFLDDCTGAREPALSRGKVVSGAGPYRVWDPVTGNVLYQSPLVANGQTVAASDDFSALVELGYPPLPGYTAPAATASVRVTEAAGGKVLLERVIESPAPAFSLAYAAYDRAESRLVVSGAVSENGAYKMMMAVYSLGAVAPAAPAAVQAAPVAAEDFDSPPPAAQAAADPDSYAVVIGIEKYRQDGIPAVDFAARDASTMYAYLTRAMGYDPKNVLLLEDDKATKNDLDKNLGRWLSNRVDAKSRVFVYYAGHGAPNPVSGEGYLMPYDGDPAYVEDTAFPISKLYADLAKLPAKDVTVVLDACFSGQGGRSLLAKGARPLVSSKPLPAAANASVLAAASGGQISASDPGRRHGLLTGYLLEALHGAADARGDGKITGDEVYAFVRPAVERAARLQNVEQTPTFTAPQGASRPWVVLPPSR